MMRRLRAWLDRVEDRICQLFTAGLHEWSARDDAAYRAWVEDRRRWP